MIAVYDSGLGGLGAWQMLRRRFPKEDLLYFADTAHLPYGEKSESELWTYAKDALAFLREFSPRGILVACGTVSATVLPRLQEATPVPVAGVIEGTASALAAAGVSVDPKKQKILILATPRTVATDAYARAIRRYLPQAEVRSVACPRFVPALEGGGMTASLGQQLCQEVLAEPDPPWQASAVVLGCTHFSLLRSALARRFPCATFWDAGQIGGEAFAQVMAKDPPREQGRDYFHITGDAQAFFARAKRYGFRGCPAIL